MYVRMSWLQSAGGVLERQRAVDRGSRRRTSATDRSSTFRCLGSTTTAIVSAAVGDEVTEADSPLGAVPYHWDPPFSLHRNEAWSNPELFQRWWVRSRWA